MRLLIVLHSCWAEGTQVLALDLCRHWLGEGHQLAVACLLPEPSNLRGEFEALGVPVTSFRLGGGLGRYPRLLIQSWRLCRRWRPDAVLSFPLGWHALVAWGARLAGVRHCCSHVGNLPPVWTGAAFAKFRFLVQLGRPVTQTLACCSSYVREATIRDFGVSPREAITIYNACDLSRFAAVARSTAGTSPRRFRLGVVGRLDDNRDYPTLIRAVALLLQQDFPVELWLIGEGEGRAGLEALIAELELGEQVTLLGLRRDIPALLAQLDLYVWPAFPLEGFGIALAEAMAAGVPIVASDVGACREVLDGERCGLLVAAGNPKALAAGIRRALSEPEASRRRAEAARERARQQFNVAAMAAGYLQALGAAPAALAAGRRPG